MLCFVEEPNDWGLFFCEKKQTISIYKILLWDNFHGTRWTLSFLVVVASDNDDSMYVWCDEKIKKNVKCSSDRRKRSTFGPLTFVKVYFLSLNFKIRQNISFNFWKPCILCPGHSYERFWRQYCIFHFYLFRLNLWKIIVNHIKFIKQKIWFCYTPDKYIYTVNI
jgi:hypothetical protein